MTKVQNQIWNVLTSIPNNTPKNKIGLFIDGLYYTSLFQAGIDSEISYTWLCLKLKKTGGAPTVIKDKTVVTANWIRSNPEYLT